MKNYYQITLVLILFFFFPKVFAQKIKSVYPQNKISLNSQEIIEPCGTDIIRREALQKNPALKEVFDEGVKDIQHYIANKKINKAANSQYRIPVVIHIIHNGEPVGTGTNISDAQIQSQMDRLNSAFDNLGGGSDSVFTDITFCLAENGSNGNTVTWSGLPGVNRIQSVQTNTDVSDAAQLSLQTVVNWPPDQFLNIWVVSTINASSTGVVGYAPQPLTGDPVDGVVIQANVFGDNTEGGTYGLLPSYNSGMAMVHEAGHYLGLYHTFQGASCTEVDCNTEGDMICDTPPTKIGSTCSTPICNGAQIENYMDYTIDSCKDTFTLGQKNWIEATINTIRPNLVSPENLVLTGVPCAPDGLLAAFEQNKSQICTADEVFFTAETTNNTATSFLWTFPEGTPSTAIGIGPHTITYNSSGDHNVILETNDGINNLVNTSVNAVNVTDCGSGITGDQAQWYFSASCAVDFRSGVPVGKSGSQNRRSEGAASVCDIDGSLKFYTDGEKAWNSSGEITSSLRVLNPSFESPSQGAVIVPDPNNNENHYIFTTPGIESVINEGIRYSLYEESSQNFPSILNNAPVNNYTITEHQAAVPHCNGTDYWLIYHGAEVGVNDKFLVYHLTRNGLSDIPIESNSFSVPVDRPVGSWIGQIDIAPNGKLMAVTDGNTDTLFIYEINRSNGLITFLASVPYPNVSSGISFSPNSEFLYWVGGTELRQYKVGELLTCETPIDYKLLMMSESSIDIKHIQLGPDGKIYINRPFEDWLDVINYPNEEITINNPNAIGYNDYAVKLPGSSRFSLPNMIDVPLGLTNADFDFCATNCGEVEFSNTSCGNQFDWDFGDGNTSTLENPSHTYTSPGTYTVNFTITTTLANGSTNISIASKTININTPDISGIIGSRSVICPTPVNQFAQYSPSSTNPNLEYYWTINGGTLVGSNPTNIAYVDWSNSGSIELSAIDPVTGCQSTVSINVSCNEEPVDQICPETLELNPELAFNEVFTTEELSGFVNTSVAISGDFCIVGESRASINDDINAPFPGGVRIYKRESENTWVLRQRIFPENGENNILFGFTVAMSGNYAIVGSTGNGPGGFGPGAVYIYELNMNSDLWEFKKQFDFPGSVDPDTTGYATNLDITSEGYAVVGANFDSTSSNLGGSAYVYKRSEAGEWQFQQRLRATPESAIATFGRSVAISCSEIVVAAFQEEKDGIQVLYTFEQENGVWQQQASLRASDPTISTGFGHSTSFSENIIATLADRDGDGAVYVYEKVNGIWEETIIEASSFNGAINFVSGRGSGGHSLSLKGTTMIVAETGIAAHILQKNGNNWDLINSITPTNSEDAAQFAGYIDINNKSIIIGSNEKAHIFENIITLSTPDNILVEEDNSLSVFPNPVKNEELNIILAGKHKNYSVNIYNVMGQLVQHIVSKSNELKTNIEMPGIYIIKDNYTNSYSKVIVE